MKVELVIGVKKNVEDSIGKKEIENKMSWAMGKQREGSNIYLNEVPKKIKRNMTYFLWLTSYYYDLLLELDDGTCVHLNVIL